MPSRFSGMDPFIESHEWEDFHHHLIEEIHHALVPNVRPRYVVRVERRVYVEHDVDQPPRPMRADVAVLQSAGAPAEGLPSVDESVSSAGIAPIVCTLPMPEEISEPYLTIRERGSLRVVTVIEILSPTNKRPGSNGHEEYLRKRQDVLQSTAHLVEIDLLRGGGRMPILEPVPPGDYYAVVSRVRSRPQADVYAWTLRQRLPVISIPLAGDDPDVDLDLSAVFNEAYDVAGYDYSLDYSGQVEPPLNDVDAAWVRDVLRNGRSA